MGVYNKKMFKFLLIGSSFTRKFKISLRMSEVREVQRIGKHETNVKMK